MDFSSYDDRYQLANAGLIPLAASLAFGLTSATLTGLFLVPSLYCILNDFDLLGEVHPEPDSDTLKNLPA
jgi:hypothetical protein